MLTTEPARSYPLLIERLQTLGSDESLTLRERARLALGWCAEFLEMQDGMIGVAEGQRYDLLISNAPEREGQTFVFEEAFCAHVLKTEQLLSLYHTTACGWGDHPGTLKHGVQAYLGIPLMAGRTRVGVVLFTHAMPRPRPFSSRAHHLIRTLADWLGAELRRVHMRWDATGAEDALRLRGRLSWEGGFEALAGPWSWVFGRAQNELEGASLLDRLAPGEMARTIDFFHSLKHGDVVTAFENTYRHPTGYEVTVRWQAHADTTTRRIECELRECTGQALLREEHHRALREDGLSRFDRQEDGEHGLPSLGEADHEVRTALNGIMGMTTLLARGELSETQREYVELLQRSTETLIKSLRQVLPLELPRQAEARAFAPAQWLAELLHPLQRHAATREVSLLVEVEEPLPRLSGDLDGLRQLVERLLGALVDHMARGELRLLLRAQQPTHRRALLELTISTPTLTLERHDDESLLRRPIIAIGEDGTPRRSDEALALALCQKLAHLLDGLLHVETGDGGLMMLLQVPFDVALQRAPIERALLLEPDALDREVLRAVLEDARVRVEVAEALDESVWRRLAPGALCPDMVCVNTQEVPDGEALLRAVSAQEHIQGVALGPSAHATKDAQTHALEKPLQRAHILGLLRRLGVMADERTAETHSEAMGRGMSSSELLSVLGRAQTSEAVEDPPDRDYVLIVEDHPINQRVLVAMLSELGLACVVEHHGQRALERALKHRPTLIFMDCQLPGLDGFSVAWNIRRHESEAGMERVPIIALTAHVSPHMQLEALESGMDSFMAKPIRREALLDALRTWYPHPERLPAPVAETSSRKQANTLDEDALRQLILECGDVGFAQMLAEDFLRDTAEHMRQLDDLEELAQLRALAHKIRGASLTFGLLGLASACDALEHAAQLDDARLASMEVRRQFLEAQHALRARLDASTRWFEGV